jgi:YggT family protein
MTNRGHSEANPIQTVVNFANILVIILEVAIFLRAMLSWFPGMDKDNLLVRILNEITEPLLAPLRQVVPKFGMIDITPMVAFLVLFVIQQALAQLA